MFPLARMKQLNFDKGEPDPWQNTQIVLWTIAAVLAGIVAVLFIMRN
jgi:hypothetical protein